MDFLSGQQQEAPMRISENRMLTVRKIKILKPIPKHICGSDCETEP